MDWNAAIDRNRTALKRVLATLIAMAGLDEDPDFQSRETDDGTPPQNTASLHPEVPPILSLPKGASKGPRPDGAAEPRKTLPRRVHLAVLRLLRPAESAVRRLIVIVARDIAVTLAPQRPPRPKPKSIYVKNGIGTGIVLPKGYKGPAKRTAPRRYCFSVTDPARRISFSPRRSSARSIPRIISFDNPRRPPLPKPPSPDDEIDATRLALRLKALASVLDDPQPYAQRFARWRARSKARRIRRVWPLRTGNPPGLSRANRRRPKHEVHGILWDIHGLAYEILDAPDTS